MDYKLHYFYTGEIQPTVNDDNDAMNTRIGDDTMKQSLTGST